MQVVSTKFSDLVRSPVRPLNWALRVSFPKTYNADTKFFVLNESLLDGADLLAPEGNNPIQAWDHYNYSNYTPRMISAEWTREISFPYSVSSAMADVTVNNFDRYFSPGSGSPISADVLPVRPLRILAGFENEVVNQYVGFTESMPTFDDTGNTASFHCVDFLAQLYELETTEIIAMQNATTDEVLVALFDLLSIPSSSYSLETGINVIPFLFYDKGTKAGTIIKALMEAEIGNLWVNEAGVIQFNNRYHTVGVPVDSFDQSNIVSIKDSGVDNIINTVNIKSKVRALQSFQSVYSITGSTENTIKANSTAVVSINIDNPCSSITDPTLGISTTTSYFTAIKTLDSTEVSSGVTCTGHSLKTNSVSLFFSNTNAFEVTINAIDIWGYPAKVIDTIDYTEIRQDSIDKFGVKSLDIENDFIQSYSQCDSIAIPILLQYSHYASQIEMTVKSNPALELDDVITVDYAPYSGEYKIIKSLVKLTGSNLSQTLTCLTTTLIKFFTLNESLLDGEDVLGI